MLNVPSAKTYMWQESTVETEKYVNFGVERRGRQKQPTIRVVHLIISDTAL